MSWEQPNNDQWGGGGHSGNDQWGGGDSGDFGASDNFNDNAGFGDAGGYTGGDARFADADGGDRPRGGACYNCGEEGHNKVDCPKPRVLRCRHCNEEGHAIRDCPDPNCPPQEEREFTGECRFCAKEGHRAADCPDRPPMMCKNCGQEGHIMNDCQSARVIDRSHVRDVTGEEAWQKITEGVEERDMDDVKEGIQEYVKASPELTYIDLEQGFRQQDLSVYIIAVEKPQLLGSLTNMDLQGNLDKKYTVTYRFDDKPARERERQFFPKDAAENLERLKDAGEPVNRGKSKCSNCEEYGHISKNCPSDRIERDQLVVRCFHCGEEGHRVRDCPQPRVDKFACKNCQQPGHKASECPEPPNPANVDCRKCGEKGHFSRDCPQGGGGGGACHNCGQEGHRARDCTEEKKIICRNCDEEGHTGRECPKPRDYSRVKCQNCGEMGHTKVRCKQPVPTEDIDGDVGMTSGGHDGYGGGFGGDQVNNGFGGGQVDNNFGGNDFGANQGGFSTGGGGGDW